MPLPDMLPSPGNPVPGRATWHLNLEPDPMTHYSGAILGWKCPECMLMLAQLEPEDVVRAKLRGHYLRYHVWR